MTVSWKIKLCCSMCSARIVYKDEVPAWQGQFPDRFVECIACGGRAYRKTSQPQSTGNAEVDLLAQLSPALQTAVRAITEDPELSEIDKMWGITETLLGDVKGVTGG